MIQSDALSRRPDLCPDDDNSFNSDKTMLSDDLFIRLIDTELQQQIANSTDMDADARDALTTLLSDGPRQAKRDLEDWTLEQEDDRSLLFYKGKNYIPQNTDLRRSIVARYHDAMTAGHPGEIETFNAVHEHYWWPGLRPFVKNYVKGCATCQQFKINRHPAKPALVAIPAST